MADSRDKDNKEPEKKKRGRPSKSPAPVKNEEKEVVTMAQTTVTPSRQNLNNGVGVVQDVVIPQNNITLDDVQNRWKTLFAKYSNLGIDTITSTMFGNGMSAMNNPFIQNRRVKQISSSPLKLSKEDLSKAINDPENNEQVLRSFSTWLAYTNYVYQNLIQLNRDTPKYCYYANPLYLEGHSKDKLKEDSERVDKILKKFNVAATFKDIAAQVYTEGKCSYLIRTSYDKKDINYLLLQKLNSDNVKITGFGSKQKFIISFNMIIFLQPGYSTLQYPQFIQDTWNEMINQGIVIEDKKGKKRINPKANLPAGHILETVMDGSYMYWVELPQDLAVTFFSNGAHPNAFPDTIGLFEDLNSLNDYRWLQGNLASRGVNAVMTAEIPYTKDAKSGNNATLASPDLVLGYSDLFSSTVSDNILPFFGPFQNFKLHELSAQPEALEIVYSNVKQLIATSGNSALLSISDKPSISATNTARMLQEAKSDYLTRQFENFLNNVINDNFDLNYDWHITLHAGLFNWREDAKMTKELVLQGSKSLLPRLLSYYDMSLEDLKGCEIYMDDLDIKLTAEKQAEDSKEETKSVGRPKANTSTIESDATGASIDQGSNVSEIKEYQLEQLEILKEQLEDLE